MYRIMSLKGKVAIVTGAGGGVGKATTKRLVLEGSKVVLIGRERQKLTNIISEINDRKNLLVIPADVTKEAEVLSAIDQTVSAFEKIDILVNNAGILDRSYPVPSDDRWSMVISNQY